MVVYADILIFLNTVVNYLILLASKRLAKAQGGYLRLILAALSGGAFSLYIFLPQQHFIVELLFKIISCAILSIIAFKLKTFKEFLRCIICQFGVSFAYVGFMIAFWYVLKPDGMAINNGIVYFSVSPLIIILSSAVCYFIITIIPKLFKRGDSTSRVAEIEFVRGDRRCTFKCIVDTGCSVSDSITQNKVAILNKESAAFLFSNETVNCALNMDTALKNLRVIPYKTISSSAVLPALKIDYAIYGEKKFDSVLIGIIDTAFDGDFSGIVSPDFLL